MTHHYDSSHSFIRYEFLEEEEEWWTQIQMQPSWKGDVEGALGLQTPIVMTLKPPHPAQFFKVTHANKTVIVNSRCVLDANLCGVVPNPTTKKQSE